MSNEDQDIFSAGETPEVAPTTLIPDDSRLVQPQGEQRDLSDALDALHKGPVGEPPKPAAKPTLRGPPAVISGEDGGDGERQHVPITALHEEREKRQALERRLELMERRLPPAQPTQPEAPYDPETMFTDPAGYTQHITRMFEQRQQTAELNFDLRLTQATNPDEFNEAWPAFLQHVSQTDDKGRGRDPVTYFRVMNSASPGAEILAWHREQQLRAELGDNPDPKSYRDRVRQQLLDDDAFMAEVAGKLGVAPPPPRSTAPVSDDRPRSPNGRFQPSTPARLPTSLSKVPGGTAAHGDEGQQLDGSDEAIWKAGNAPRRRR